MLMSIYIAHYRTVPLMRKTAVYALVNGVIVHQKQKILNNVILCSSTLTLGQCHAA